jgi:pyridoxine kinase
VLFPLKHLVQLGSKVVAQVAEQSIIVSQDLCGAGTVSLGAAIPILTALELRPRVIPTALLSTHTGVPDNTYLDLSNQIGPILAHWQTLPLAIGGLYLGYLGPNALTVWQEWLPRWQQLPLRLVDPAMADNGHLYRGLDDHYVAEMRKLITHASIVTPNITEAQLLLGQRPTVGTMTERAVQSLTQRLVTEFHVSVIITGITLPGGKTGVAWTDAAAKEPTIWAVDTLPGHYFGTGDIFASVLAGGLMRGKCVDDAIRVAMRFVGQAIDATNRLADPTNPLHDVDFGTLLPELINDFS